MSDAPARSPDPRWTHALMYRWWVEYNPMYLVSAALTLGGVIALSQGLAAHRGFAAQMGITAIAEVYAWALIGSAALLVRRGRRRPAVMLALLAGVYQCDPTLHTTTCAWLGVPGAIGTIVWLASFVTKLRALAWAMQLRMSPGAAAILSAGGAGVAWLPWALRELDPPVASTLVVTWVFGLFAAASWSHRRVGSRVPLDAWGVLVARRSLRGAWIGFGVMLIVHVGFWTSQHPGVLSPGMFAPVVALLATRLVRVERRVWLAVVATAAWVAISMPGQLAITATMAAAVLLLRAFRYPEDVTPRSNAAYRFDPYRAPIVQADPVAPYRVFVRAPGAERIRLVIGAGVCLYVAAWTVGWSEGPWPAHALGLDLLLLLAGVIAWHRGHGLAMLPGVVALAHHAATVGWISAPRSLVSWGVTATAAGFAMLALSVAASLRYGRVTVPRVAGPPAPRPKREPAPVPE